MTRLRSSLEDVQIARPADRAGQLDHVRHGAVHQPALALRDARLSLNRKRDVGPIKLVAQAAANDLAPDEGAKNAPDRGFRQLRVARADPADCWRRARTARPGSSGHGRASDFPSRRMERSCRRAARDANPLRVRTRREPNNVLGLPVMGQRHEEKIAHRPSRAPERPSPGGTP